MTTFIELSDRDSCFLLNTEKAAIFQAKTSSVNLLNFVGMDFQSLFLPPWGGGGGGGGGGGWGESPATPAHLRVSIFSSILKQTNNLVFTAFG